MIAGTGGRQDLSLLRRLARFPAAPHRAPVVRRDHPVVVGVHAGEALGGGGVDLRRRDVAVVVGVHHLELAGGVASEASAAPPATSAALAFGSLPLGLIGRPFRQADPAVMVGVGAQHAVALTRLVLRQRHRTTEAASALGVVFQITSGSLLGYFGPRAQTTAEAILTHAAEWPLVIASDTHDLSGRPPNLLAEARDAAATIVGADEAQKMVDARPRTMVTPV